MSLVDLQSFEDAVTSGLLPLTAIKHSGLASKGLRWSMLRLDLCDVDLSGNKAFKLLPYLKAANAANIDTLLSFGGVHSNHVHALSFAGARFGFNTIGVIRGYKEQVLSPTLLDAVKNGMKLHFAGSVEYRRRYDPGYISELIDMYGPAFVIPEGGAGYYGAKGGRLMAVRMLDSLSSDMPDYFCMSAGTGCSVRSVVNSGLFEDIPIMAFCALKAEAVGELRGVDSRDCLVLDDYAMGGFARLSPELASFMLSFEKENGFFLDPVYTAKMCFGISDLIAKGYFRDGSHIVSVHTGGVQGRRFALPKLIKMSESRVI